MPFFNLPENEIFFPDPSLAEDDGLLAVGGDLSIERLLLAYTNGIFPWYGKDDPILWWCPKQRFIIRPSGIHVSKSMKKFMRKHKVSISINRDFKETIRLCRNRWEPAGTWLLDDMEQAYIRLYERGFALSVEAYVDGETAGGLYGVSIGRCFFGESMFSLMENGSKVALILLARFLEQHDYLMIDCQLHTDHLESMGGEWISYEEYKEILKEGFTPK